MLTTLREASSGLVDLFFPRVCVACDGNNPIEGQLFCVHCAYRIAPTDHWVRPTNEFTQKFTGRIQLQQGAALYKFFTQGLFQQVIHKLKYESRPEIGVHLGKIAGKKIMEHWQKPEVVIPVPIHPKKEWIRGYNQSEKIATGISEVLNIRICKALVKKVHTPSQTGYHRMERMKNVHESIELATRQDLRGKHVLIVDDLLTTGATLESCALKLQHIEGLTVSLCTLGIGQQY